MTKTKQLKIPELKKHLRTCDKKELIQIITELYKLNSDAAEYLSVKYGGDEEIQALFEKAQQEINNEFFPDRGFGKMRLSHAKKAISRFKKLTNDERKTIELMVYYVEIGTLFTNTYGDIDERFYDSMNSMYDRVIAACEKDEQLFKQLQPRLFNIVENANGIGWGYHDNLADSYNSINWLNS
ncbi:hypothetical protein J18TS1_22270 [Oceanobacillus oncorhynchi subsp. incaldanensis]|uniref:Uncharacterized protein n=1 Tax=Oceanobacillus oncorhynchi TaxID=545501 RepID=A0A0A1MQT9_9BACI|nr:DUF6155 family protein [Oceanobacillus oncorhynchi]GIO19127.1 hypothetical protein J18TS1_22270 [Oceanobacillus oncorhynchi subsp. incaldanensis]CEI81386.1 hypothetical protein BN997_01206 [Oceanobacillus oncorhynchi]